MSGLTSFFFVLFVYFVERRQRIVMDRVVTNAAKAAAAERDLNEYLAHEIRNPLSSAMAAHIALSIQQLPKPVPYKILLQIFASRQKACG